MDKNRNYILSRIRSEGFFHTADTTWLTPEGKQAQWTFDLKALFLDKDFLNAVAAEFWLIHDKTQPIQICGLESASIPLVAALVLTGEKANGLYIRKSRKKKYDLREIEGKLNDAPIVVVDDIINYGVSLEKQIRALKKLSHDVRGFFACVHLQRPEYYAYLVEGYGIRPNFLFGLPEFGETYGQSYTPKIRFDETWRIDRSSGHEFNVTKREQIDVSEHSVYLNADDGQLYALSKENGSTYWKTRVQKAVPFSGNQPGPRFTESALFVPTEHGALYCLDDRTGAVIEQHSLLDHIYGTLYLFEKRKKLVLTGRAGGADALVIFDLASRTKIGEYRTSERIAGYTALGEDGLIFTTVSGKIVAIDMATGARRWEGVVQDIFNDGITLDPKAGKGYLVGNSGTVYVLSLSNGTVLTSRAIVEEPFFFSRPVLFNGRLYVTSLHRTCYCVDADSLECKWEYNTRGRIFGGVVVHEGVAFFGNNEGVLYALNAETGELLGTHVIGDRIVSAPIVEDNGLIVSTLGNQIVRLSYSPNDSKT